MKKVTSQTPVSDAAISANSTPPRAGNPLRSFVYAIVFCGVAALTAPATTATPPMPQTSALYALSSSRDRALEKLSSLPIKWVDPDAVEVREHTLASARSVLIHLPLDLPSPHLSSSADGEIGFGWRLNRKRFEAALDADGNLVWAVKAENRIGALGEIAVNSIEGRVEFYDAIMEFYVTD